VKYRIRKLTRDIRTFDIKVLLTAFKAKQDVKYKNT